MPRASSDAGLSGRSPVLSLLQPPIITDGNRTANPGTGTDLSPYGYASSNFQSDPDRYYSSSANPDTHLRSYSHHDANASADVHPGPYLYPATNRNTIPDPHAPSNLHPAPNCNTAPNAHTSPDQHAYTDLYADSSTNPHTDLNSATNAHSRSNADTNSTVSRYWRLDAIRL